MRYVLLALALFVCAGARAQSPFDGAWDVVVDFDGGSSAGVMRLSSDAGAITGTSEPLDENQFFPLDIAGQSSGESTDLTFRFQDQLVGRVTVERTGGALQGAGTLYSVPVTLSAKPSDRTFRAPTVHDFVPTTFELQYESRREPVLSLVPGDRVRTSLLDNRGQDAAMDWKAMPGNTLTGPFFIEGAMPGDTLVVHLNTVKLNRKTAKMYSSVLNKHAVQADHIQTPIEGWGRTWRLDLEKGTAHIEAPGSAVEDLTLPLAPMVGSIGVAPPLNMALYAGDLWIHGGNMDYRRFGEGTTIYIPVYRAGAYLVLGDGHALQGDGEISGQGLETSLDVEFTVDLIPDQRDGYLWSENSEFVMVHGIDSTLDKALQVATTGLSRWLKSRYGLNDSEIAAVLSPAIEYDIAVIVNSRPHVVARLP